MGEPATPWEVLGVSRNATQAEIKSAFRAACKTHHPDLCRDPQLRKGAEQRMQAINEAYTRLANPRVARWNAPHYNSPGFKRPWTPAGASPASMRASSIVFAAALSLPFFMVGVQMLRSEPGGSGGDRAMMPTRPVPLNRKTVAMGYNRTH